MNDITQGATFQKMNSPGEISQPILWLSTLVSECSLTTLEAAGSKCPCPFV